MDEKVRREEGRVWIEGVPDGKIGQRWVMLLEGMQILLEHRGDKVALDELMVCSGDAFNLCHATNWELRTEHSVPTDALTNVAEAYGYDCEWTPSHWFAQAKKMDEAEKKKVIDKHLDRIQSQLEKGFPVLMGGAYGQCRDWRVVVGLDRGRRRICCVGGEEYYDWTDLMDPKVNEFAGWEAQIRGAIKPHFYGGWQTNAAFLMREKRADVSDKEKALMALQRAVEMHKAQEWSTDWYGEVTYYFGEKAYEQWARDLESLDYPADLEKAKDMVGDFYDMSNMEFQVDQIVRGRTAAAEFCERTSSLFPGAKQHLLEASRHYHKEVEIARETLGVFLLSGEEAKQWLSDKTNCEQGAVAVREMLKQERAAIAEVEKALVC